MKVYAFFCSILLIIVAMSCAPVRTVVPLEKGETHVSASLGGPLIEFSGLVIPVPLTSVNVSHGVKENFTLNGALHTTSMLFGVIHLEVSTTISLHKFKSETSGITATGGYYFMIDTWEGKSRLYPTIDMNIYKQYGDKNHLMYGSLTLLYDWSQKKSGKFSDVIIPSFTFGHTWKREKMNYTLELKYLSFLKNNMNIVVDYVSPINKGAFGIQFGVTRKF
jgi:hypothetical protein